MNYKTIDIEKEKNVSTVRLNRPEVHNALNEQLMKELTLFFNQINEYDSNRVIILTGNGKSFCAGADLQWMKSMVKYSKEENINDSRLLLNLYESIYNCPKPVIGKINGNAFGGGIGLIAVCDIAFSVPNCLFAFSEVNLGIIPSVISSYIANRLKPSDMRRLFISGEKFNSEYARIIGLIDFVISVDKLDIEIDKYVNILKSSGPKAIFEIKKLVNSYQRMNKNDYKEYTVKKISDLRISDEGQEGINAFLEKRKSKWS